MSAKLYCIPQFLVVLDAKKKKKTRSLYDVYVKEYNISVATKIDTLVFSAESNES